MQTRSKKMETDYMQTRSKKMETDFVSNLPFKGIQIHRRSNEIETDNAENLVDHMSVKRKAINNSLMKLIQTQSKKFKADNANNLPLNVIQTQSKKFKADNANNLPLNVIQTQSKKFKADNARNLPLNVIQTRSKEMKTVISNNLALTDIQTYNKIIRSKTVQNLLEHNSVKSQMTIQLQYLPYLVLESIFEHFTFHEIATLRILCRKFNEIGKRLLNKGYRILVHQNIWEPILKAGKLSMPFERNLYDFDSYHSLLDLAFYFHINEKRCCFFPGKVLDIICDIFFIENKVGTKSFTRRTTQSEVCEYLTAKRVKNFVEICRKALEHAFENIFPAFNISIKSTSFILLSSTPMLLDKLVLKSALGRLSVSDFVHHFFMADDALRGKVQRISMINQLEQIKIKYHNPRQGLNQNYVPEKMLGVVKINGQYSSLIKWKGLNEAEFVTHHEYCPKLGQVVNEYWDYWFKGYSIGNTFEK